MWQLGPRRVPNETEDLIFYLIYKIYTISIDLFNLIVADGYCINQDRSLGRLVFISLNGAGYMGTNPLPPSRAVSRSRGPLSMAPLPVWTTRTPAYYKNLCP